MSNQTPSKKIIFLDDTQYQFLFPKNRNERVAPCFVKIFKEVFQNSDGKQSDWEFEFYTYENNPDKEYPLIVYKSSREESYCTEYLEPQGMKSLLDVIKNIDISGAYLYVDFLLNTVRDDLNEDDSSLIFDEIFKKIMRDHEQQIPAYLCVYTVQLADATQKYCNDLNENFKKFLSEKWTNEKDIPVEWNIPIGRITLNRNDIWIAEDQYESAFHEAKMRFDKLNSTSKGEE